jgi:hypothetical protein
VEWSSTNTRFLPVSSVSDSTRKEAWSGSSRGSRSIVVLLVRDYDERQYRPAGSFHQKWPRSHVPPFLTQPRPQFVELNVGEVEIVKDAVVEGGAVCPSSCQPGRDGGVAVTEHAHGGGHIEPFGQGCQHFANPVGCGFEAIEGVSRRVLKVVRHAWQRKVSLRSCCPCAPSPTSA